MTHLWTKDWVEGLEGGEIEKVTLEEQENWASINMPLNMDQILIIKKKDILRRGNISKEK